MLYRLLVLLSQFRDRIRFLGSFSSLTFLLLSKNPRGLNVQSLSACRRCCATLNFVLSFQTSHYVNHIVLVHTIQCVVILFHRVFLTWIDDTSIDEWLTVSASTSRSSGRIFCPFFMNQSLSLGGLKRSLTFLHYLGSALDY